MTRPRDTEPPPDESNADERRTDERRDDTDEPAVSTVPLDTEDGGTVVLHQQNVGPGSQVGAGEFKEEGSYRLHKRPEEAAEEERRLEEERPT